MRQRFRNKFLLFSLHLPLFIVWWIESTNVFISFYLDSIFIICKLSLLILQATYEIQGSIEIFCIFYGFLQFDRHPIFQIKVEYLANESKMVAVGTAQYIICIAMFGAKSSRASLLKTSSSNLSSLLLRISQLPNTVGVKLMCLLLLIKREEDV